MTQWSMAANRIDVSSAHRRGTPSTSFVRVSTARRQRPHAQGRRRHGPTLVGVGFRDAVWADVPSLAMLDAVTQGVPVALISHDLHCVWLNSAAARRYGVEVDDGGLLREEPAFALTRALGRMPDAVVDEWVGELPGRPPPAAWWGSWTSR